MFQVDLLPSNPRTSKSTSAALDKENLNAITFHWYSNQVTLSGSRYCSKYNVAQKAREDKEKIYKCQENGFDHDLFFDLEPDGSVVCLQGHAGEQTMRRLDRQATP